MLQSPTWDHVNRAGSVRYGGVGGFDGRGHHRRGRSRRCQVPACIEGSPTGESSIDIGQGSALPHGPASIATLARAVACAFAAHLVRAVVGKALVVAGTRVAEGLLAPALFVAGAVGARCADAVAVRATANAASSVLVATGWAAAPRSGSHARACAVAMRGWRQRSVGARRWSALGELGGSKAAAFAIAQSGLATARWCVAAAKAVGIGPPAGDRRALPQCAGEATAFTGAVARAFTAHALGIHETCARNSPRPRATASTTERATVPRSLLFLAHTPAIQLHWALHARDLRDRGVQRRTDPGFARSRDREVCAANAGCIQPTSNQADGTRSSPGDGSRLTAPS